MSGYNLGTASGRISIDGKGAALGFKVAQTAAGSFFDLIKYRVKEVQDLGKKMAGAGLAGTAGFGLAIKTAADFQQQMSGVAAVVNGTGDEMDALKQKALKLGADTSFSASEAASAIEELAKAGIGVEDILNGAAEGAVNLAAAGGVGLAEAATIASNAMNQFGIDASHVTDVADVLAGVANVSAADVDDLGQALQQSGAVAALAGLSFRDTSIALGEMADAGVRGSDAGTSLKTFLNRLIPVTDKQRAKFQELGLVTYRLADANKALRKLGLKQQKSMSGVNKVLDAYFDKAGLASSGTATMQRKIQDYLRANGAMRNAFFKTDGSIKGLKGIQDTLAKSLEGMTNEQKLATLQVLFGADAMRASAILANKGADGYAAYNDELAQTTAADVAKKRLDNLAGAIEEFRGSVETALITIGDVFLPMLKKFFEALTWLVNIFNKLPKGVKVAIAVLGALASSGLLVLGVFLAMLPILISIFAHFLLMRIITSITGGFRLFFATLKAGNGVLAATEAGALRTGGSLRVLTGRMLASSKAAVITGKAFLRMWAFITGPIGIAIGIILAIVGIGVLLYKKWKPFHDLVDKIAGILKEKLLAVWAALQPVLLAAWEALKKVGDFIVQSLLPVLVQVGKELFGKLMDGWRQISEAVLTQLLPALKDLWAKIQGDLIPAMISLWQAVQPVIKFVGGVLVVVFKVLAGILLWVGKMFIKYLLPIIIKVVGWLAGQLIDAVVGFIKAVIQVITGVVKLFSGLIDFFKGLFTGNWSKMWQGIKEIFVGIWDIIWGLLKAYWYVGFIKLLGLGFKAVFAIFKYGWKFILAIFKGAGKGIWAAVKWIGEFVWKLITGYFKLWINVFKWGWRFITKVVRGAINLVKSIIFGVFKIIKGIITRDIALIRNVFSRAWNFVKNRTVTAFTRIRDAVKNTIGGVVDFVKGLPGKIIDAVKGFGTLLYDAGRKLIQGLLDGLNSMIQPLKDGVSKIADIVGRFWPGSPVREGPLVSWNDGKTGEKLVDMLLTGIDTSKKDIYKSAGAMAGALSDGLAKHVKAVPVDSWYDFGKSNPTQPVGLRSNQPKQLPRHLWRDHSRIVDGTLKIDKSGKAWIKATAQDVYDNNDRGTQAHHRMRGLRVDNGGNP